MIDKEMLAQACMDLDSRADEGVKFADIIDDMKIDKDGLRYAAEQRALRMVLIARGDHMVARLRNAAYRKQFTIEKLSGRERAMAESLMIAWMDGAAIMAQTVKTAEGN